ncbi:MAG: PDZ domain-containing protein [Ruminococcaceae bacterium]|nr:PDZ domain-containing protein [Oscillospiraceae bacterium]
MKRTKIFSLVLSGIMLFGHMVSAEEYAAYDEFEMLSNYAANLYIDDSVTGEYLMDEALKKVMEKRPELANELIKAAFASLDEYSEFYTPEEYELFNKNIDHIVYGIGVVIQKMGDYVTVMSVVEGGGAEAAGILPEDRISKVNGVDVKGESVDKVQDMVVGELGTDVTITFLRGDTEFDRTITRQEVTGTTVTGVILKGNIGYIEILNFASKTDTEFFDVLSEFNEAGVKKIILDLRGNPGGYLVSAINVANSIVPKGVICSTVYRNEEENEVFESELEKSEYEFAVLIDKNTASAAEVIASALKDSEAGILIGEKSYGKGVIQQMFQLYDGSAFKVTTGRYFTRNGMDINGGGIEPHEQIDNTTKRIDITKYSTFDYKTKPKVGETSPNVFAAKERLYIMGLYQGKLDENFDEELEKAVRDFQGANGLYPYGVLDISTQVKIENSFYVLEELVDKQLIFAYEYFGGNADELYEE